MAEEIAVAEPKPAEQAPEQGETVLKNFGDMAAAFDKVFPATAEKPEAAQRKEAPAPVPPTPTEPPAPAPVPAPAPESPKQTSELPDFLSGEKKAETAPPPGDPDIPPPTGKESVGMKQLRTAYDNLKKQSAQKEAEYKTMMDAAKASPPEDVNATITGLQAQLKERDQIIARRNIEDLPAFRAQFDGRRQQLVADAHQMLKDAGADPIQWDRAMTLTGVARQNALDDLYEALPRSVANELGATSRDVRTLDSQREAALADQNGLRQRLEQQAAQQQFQALKEHETQTLQFLDMAEHDLVDRLGIEVYKKSEDPAHQKWNDSIDKMKADAKKILLEVDDPSVMARAALLAPAAIQFRYLYHTFRDKYLEEKKKNDATSAAEPSLATRGEAPVEEDKNLTFAEAVARQFK